MDLAESEFDIPRVVSPENLASSHLDELSGMIKFQRQMFKFKRFISL